MKQTPHKLSQIELALQNQTSRVKEALRAVREIVHGLAPKDLYLRLKDIPENEYLLSEYVLVRTFELVHPFQQENKELSLQVATFTEELKFKNESKNQILS